MITIQDWFATIPEEDKHIAFVGEHQSVTRQFLVTGDGWKTYEDWGFHLDMAFDLSTVTSKADRQVESTQVSNTENVSDTLIKLNGTTKKEKYTVTEVDVDCADKTDIATLKKKVLTDGIRLTWTVLRQHTQLPGKLRATLRALGPDGQVKKSDLMVFEVDPAVVAESAADIPQSEFEAMEEHMDEMLDAVLKNAQMVEIHLATMESALETVEDIQANVDTSLDRVNKTHAEMVTAKEEVQQAIQEVQKEADRLQMEWPVENQGFDLVRGSNWLNMEEVTHNKGQLANGLIGNDGSKKLSLTGYIPVKEGDVLSYQRTDPTTGKRIYGNLYAVCLFDEHKVVNFEANQYKAGEDGTLHEITIPAGVAYVRLTLHHLDTAVNPAIAPYTQLVLYEPFWEARKLKADGYDAAHIDAAIQPVRYVAQTLTEAQKAQVRANIGVTLDQTLDPDSGNPVQNRAVAQAVEESTQRLEQITSQLAQLEQVAAVLNTEMDALRVDSSGKRQETAKGAVMNSIMSTGSSLYNEIEAVRALANNATTWASTANSNLYSVREGLNVITRRVEQLEQQMSTLTGS